MRRAPTRPQNTVRSPVRALLACAALAVGALATPAQAQIEDSAPRWVVVTKDASPVRCDDFERFYKVASLDTGDVLRTDGRSDQWARVVYPFGVPALVPAADARIIDERTIELTSPSRLRAPSAILGIAGSWRSLYSEAVPAGTRLEVIEREIGANNEVAAFRVKAPRPPVAPEPPYAYIKLEFIRDATPAEAAAHLKALSAIPGASPVPVEKAVLLSEATEILNNQSNNAIEPITSPQTSEPAEAVVVEAPIEQGRVEGSGDVVELTDDAISTGSGGWVTGGADDKNHAPGASDSLLEPMVLPGQEQTHEYVFDDVLAQPTLEELIDAGNYVPTVFPPDEFQENASPFYPAIEISEQAPAEAPQPVLAPEPASIEDLEVALTSVRRLPREALDEALDELYAEYQRTLRASEASGEDEKILDAVRRRITWLELRIETRDQRRALDAALREADTRDDAIASGVRTWQAGRSYTMVGRLAPSAVYNGKRLPLMYRVLSIDPLTGPRTIGYVRPEQGQRLDGRLGQIVGIIGSTTDDDALNLRIIRPERVDVLDTSAFANAPSD